MEIGPVTGVRAVSLLTVQKTTDAQPPVFEIDASARTGDETYSPSRQAPDRGLENEDSDAAADDEAEQETPQQPGEKGTRIDFFA